MEKRPIKPLRRFPKRIRPSFGQPISALKKRPQRLSRLSDVLCADDLDIPEECRGWGDEDASPRPMDVEWQRVCATSVFPVVSSPPKKSVAEGSTKVVTLDQWSCAGSENWLDTVNSHALTEEEEAEKRLAMFEGHVVNIAKGAAIDEAEFVEWLTDGYIHQTSVGTKMDLLQDLAAEMSPPGYQYSDLSHVCYRLRHGPTQDTAIVDGTPSGQKPSRLDLLTRAVVELATLRDPEAVGRSPEWNDRTETMAYVVDAYLDAHFTQLCVEAMERGEDCEEKSFNVPEDFQDGYRGRWWKFMALQAEAVKGGGKGDEGCGDDGDGDDDSDARCSCICW